MNKLKEIGVKHFLVIDPDVVDEHIQKYENMLCLIQQRDREFKKIQKEIKFVILNLKRLKK